MGSSQIFLWLLDDLNWIISIRREASCNLTYTGTPWTYLAIFFILSDEWHIPLFRPSSVIIRSPSWLAVWNLPRLKRHCLHHLLSNNSPRHFDTWVFFFSCGTRKIINRLSNLAFIRSVDRGFWLVCRTCRCTEFLFFLPLFDKSFIFRPSECANLSHNILLLLLSIHV